MAKLKPTIIKKTLDDGSAVTVISVPKSPNIRPVNPNTKYAPPRRAIVRSPQPFAHIANTKWIKSTVKSTNKNPSSN